MDPLRFVLSLSNKQQLEFLIGFQASQDIQGSDLS